MKDTENYSRSALVWALRKYGQVGPRTFRALMIHFPTLSSIFRAEIDEISNVSGLGKKRSRKIYECDKFLKESEEFIESLDIRDIGTCTTLDDDYPEYFNELNDPPPLIFYRGKLPGKDEKLVSLIGSREATNDGIARAVDLAGALAEKSASIVSGLARGIDTAGHVGALRAGGNSYAILGSGFDHIMPEENSSLAIELVRKGALISEYPPDQKQTSGSLIDRNRLTVGISQAVVIGQIVGKSPGTLDCARFCHESGKLVFILIDDINTTGDTKKTTEKIISFGAIPISLSEAVETITRSLV